MRNTAGLTNTGPDAQGVVNNSSCNRRLLKGAGYSIPPGTSATPPLPRTSAKLWWQFPALQAIVPKQRLPTPFHRPSYFENKLSTWGSRQRARKYFPDRVAASSD